MSIARGMVIAPTKLELPLLNFPVEQLYAQMQQSQQDYDVVGSLSSTVPKHLEQDVEWANKYKEYAQAVSNEVTQAFSSGDSGKAMRMLTVAKQDLASQWQPGGLAASLQDRYDSYSKGVEELKKAAEKDPTNLNYQYGANRFKQGIGDLDYDYSTGKYNRIGTPTVYNYTDINKKILENAKAIEPTITENDIVNGMWIEKFKAKGYDADRVQAVMDGVFSSPDVMQQIDVNTFGKTQNMTPEQLQGVIQEDYTGKLKVNEQNKKSLSKLSVEQQQKFLAAKGLYNGNIDGKKGKLTQEALDNYNAQLDNEAEQIKSYEVNPQEYIKQKYVVQPLKEQFVGYLGRGEEGRTLRPNQVALQQQRLSAAKKLQDNEFRFQEQLLQKENESGLYTPSTPIDIEREFKGAIKDAKQFQLDAKKDLISLGKDPVVSQLYGTNGGDDDYDKLRQPLQAFGKSDNLEEFAKNVNMKPNEAKAMYYDLLENAADYKDRLVVYDNATNKINDIAAQQTAIYKETAPDVFKAEYEKYKKEGKLKSTIDINDPKLIKQETLEEFTQALIDASQSDKPDKRFVQVETGGSNYQGVFGGNVGTPKEVNTAQYVMREAGKKSQEKINSGYVPKTSVRYRATGTDPKMGYGRFQDAVQTDMRAGNLTGYEDALTGNRDEFTTVGSDNETVAMSDLDPTTVKVAYESGIDKALYTITAKSTVDGKYKTIRAKQPTSHEAFSGTLIQQEFAVAVNQDNLEDAAKAGRFWLNTTGDVLDAAGANVKPNNNNIVGKQLSVNLGGQAFTVEKPFAKAYSTDYDQGYKMEVVTFNEKGRQKWATTLVDPAGNRTMVGKAMKGNGTIIARTDHSNIADMTYNTYTDALDQVALFKAANEINVDAVYSTIPKDLKGIGLGTTRSKQSQVLVEEQTQEEDGQD